MKTFIAAILLFALSAYAAEPTPDPRLVRIVEMRQMLMLQKQNAELAHELTLFKLRDLEREEEKIKAEKPKEKAE